MSLTDASVTVEHGEDALTHVAECSLAFAPSLFKCLLLCLCVFAFTLSGLCAAAVLLHHANALTVCLVIFLLCLRFGPTCTSIHIPISCLVMSCSENCL